jgi:Tol biopolymer transport system component
MALWTIAFQNDGSPSRRLGATGSEVYDPAVAKRGRLAYTRRFVDSNIWRQQISSRAGVRPPPLSLITSTAEDRNPQYSPIDGRIAFQSWRSGNSEVVICGSDGNRCVQLTTMNGPHTGSPRWSPDGKRIAFDSAAAGNFDIYVIDVNGGPPRRLTNDSATDAIPSWSADGKWIYFESARSGTVQIWKIPAEGGAVVQVTRNGGVTAFEATDGKTLYYTKENHLSKLWKSSVDGSGETAVLDGVMMRAFVVFKNRIYYLHPEPGGATELRCFLLATGKDSLVTKIAKPVTLGLSVSPDGSQIIYAQVDHRGSDLSLIDNFR